MTETMLSDRRTSDDQFTSERVRDVILFRSITNGLRNIIRSVILLIVISVILFGVFGIYFVSHADTLPGPVKTLVALIVLGALPSIVYVRGVWQITSRASNPSSFCGNPSLRNVARGGSLFLFVSLIIMLIKFNERGLDLLSEKTSTTYLTLDLIQSALAAVVTAGYIAVLLHLRTMVSMLPSKAMHPRIGVVIVVYALTYAFNLPFSFLSDLSIPHSEFAANASLSTFYLGFLVIWGLSLLCHTAASIWAIVIIYRAKNLFEQHYPPSQVPWPARFTAFRSRSLGHAKP